MLGHSKPLKTLQNSWYFGHNTILIMYTPLKWLADIHNTYYMRCHIACELFSYSMNFISSCLPIFDYDTKFEFSTLPRWVLGSTHKLTQLRSKDWRTFGHLQYRLLDTFWTRFTVKDRHTHKIHIIWILEST